MLDAAQRQVVAHDRGVLRVLAGPGTGKTTTLVEAVVDRVHNGVPIEQILLLTFSRRAAAGQLRDRVTARLQRTISRAVVARTFHSYAFGLVRQAGIAARATRRCGCCPVPSAMSRCANCSPDDYDPARTTGPRGCRPQFVPVPYRRTLATC